MDPLTRLLEFNRKAGYIKGHKLANNATPMTNSMFADDLLIMGVLSNHEVTKLVSVLDVFCNLSGMKVNEAKSRVWFSANASSQARMQFMQMLKVQEAGEGEKYLGCPVSVAGTASFDYIVEKFENRLNSWKSKLLSHAGRLILLKAVLESLPVYAMGTVILPSKVICKLNAIMRNFFWGGTDDGKHMPYVAWRKITTPKGMGGLGLRSLKEMNQALVAKNIWKIASGAEVPWVQLIQAKYYPRGCFWTTNRKYTCSKLWRQMVQLKATFQPHLLWKIGNGERIGVFAQPWIPNSPMFVPASRQDREAKLCDLINQETRTWDFDALQQLFGFQTALSISTMDAVKPVSAPAADCLLFTYAKNGKFSVGKAYQLLKDNRPGEDDRAIWKWLWKEDQLLPKLQMFIWRGIHNALPVRAVIARRIQTISATCQICDNGDETIMHALFQCDFARATWLASPLGLRTDQLHGDFKETIWGAVKALPSQEFCRFICFAWAVWRSRNDVVHGSKQQSFQVCMQYFQREEQACQIKRASKRVACFTESVPQPMQSGSLASTIIPDVCNQFRCFVDGSWDATGQAGVGIILLKGDTVMQWVSKAIQATNASQAEARAVLEGYKLLRQHTDGQGIVLSDSAETVASLQGGTPNLYDWRSYDEIWSAWRLQIETGGALTTMYCNRNDESLKIAHNLANQGRVYCWDRIGFINPVFEIQQLM